MHLARPTTHPTNSTTTTRPFNSWGRQPFITSVRDGKTPSITPALTHITQNFVIANYNSQEAIDNDDASEYFHTTQNVFVYGGNGLKGYFGGHDNTHSHNIYAFTIGHCVNIGYGHEFFLKGHEDTFTNNKCIMQQAGPYAKIDCSKYGQNSSSIYADVRLGNNSVFDPAGKPISMCGKPFATWQQEGFDVGTTLAAIPPSAQIIGWIHELLQ